MLSPGGVRVIVGLNENSEPQEVLKREEEVAWRGCCFSITTAKDEDRTYVNTFLFVCLLAINLLSLVS